MPDVKSPAGPVKGRATKSAGGYQAPALDKGLEILEFLARTREPHGLADLAKALDRSKNELYRMALVLERRGYLQRTVDDRFALTNRLFEIAMRTPPSRNLHDAALPVMHELSEELEQSCHLAVRNENDIVVVARVESPGLLGFAVRVGYRRQVVTSASGSVLFGFATEPGRKAWSKLLQKSAPADVDFEAFVRKADEARERGYAMVASATVPGIVDIATPVYNEEEPGPVAALTIPFLTRHEQSEDAEAAALAVVRAARRITEKLKHG